MPNTKPAGAHEPRFQLEYGTPGFLLGQLVVTVGMVFQLARLSSSTGFQWPSDPAASQATAIRIFIFASSFILVFLLGKDRYILLRGPLSIPQRFLIIIGLGFKLQPGSRWSTVLWPHRLLFVHLASTIARIDSKWYWLGCPFSWFGAVLIDYADPEFSCSSLWVCVSKSLQDMVNNPWRFMQTVAAHPNSAIYAIDAIIAGLLLTYVEQAAHKAWQRRDSLQETAAASQQTSSSQCPAKASTVARKQHKKKQSPSEAPPSQEPGIPTSSKVRSWLTLMELEPPAPPDCCSTSGSNASSDNSEVAPTCTMHPSTPQAVDKRAPAEKALSAAIPPLADSVGVPILDLGAVNTTTTAVTAAASAAVTAGLAAALPRLGSLMGSEALLELLENASKAEPVLISRHTVVQPYQGRCRVDTASIKVAASHSDITTLGPLLQSSLMAGLTATDSSRISQASNTSAGTVVSDAICFKGCVHMLGYIISANQEYSGSQHSEVHSSNRISSSSSYQSSNIKNTGISVSAAATLLAAVQTALLQHTATAASKGYNAHGNAACQSEALPPVCVSLQGSVVSSANCGSLAASGKHMQNRKQQYSSLAYPQSKANWPGSRSADLKVSWSSAVVRAGEECRFQLSSAGCAGACSSVPCRLLVSQAGSLLADRRVLAVAGEPCSISVPPVAVGVLHLCLLPAEGPMHAQVQPIIRQVLLVLPAAAADELQKLVQDQQSSMSELAQDVAYVLGTATAGAVSAVANDIGGASCSSSVLPATKAAVLKQIAAYLIKYGCYETLETIMECVWMQQCSGQRAVPAGGSATEVVQPIDNTVMDSRGSACSRGHCNCLGSSSSADALKDAAESASCSAGANSAADAGSVPGDLQPAAAAEQAVVDADASGWWDATVQQLLFGFHSRPLEEVYLRYVAQQGLFGDWFAAVLSLVAAANLNLLTLPVSHLGQSRLVAWEVCSRTLNVALLFLPNWLQLLYRRRLLVPGKCEPVAMWCDWCFALVAIAKDTGLMCQSKVLNSKYTHTSFLRTVML